MQRAERCESVARMGQISVKLKKFFSRLKTWTELKTSVDEAEIEKEVKESIDDQILSHEVKEEFEKTEDGNSIAKNESSAEKHEDVNCSHEHLSFEDYNKQMASLEKAIDEQQKLIEEHNCKIATIEKILQSESPQENAKNSEEQQNAAVKEEEKVAVQNGTADHFIKNEELTEQQLIGQHNKTPMVIADELEAQQTKIEVIREMLEEDRGVYCRGRQVTEQLASQYHLLDEQERSIEKLKAEFREQLRYQNLQLYIISTGIIIALIIIASFRL